MKQYDWVSDAPDDSGWKSRHRNALLSPMGFERPIVGMLRGWIQYAERHRQQYESTIGEDGVLGPAWAQIGDGIRQLLNGDCGRLDCGTLDSIIHDNLREAGFDPDQL